MGTSFQLKTPEKVKRSEVISDGPTDIVTYRVACTRLKIKTCFYPQIEGIIDMTNKLVFVTSLFVSCNIFPSLLVSCNLIACVSQHLSVPFYKSMPLSNSSFFLLLLFITTEYFPLFLR